VPIHIAELSVALFILAGSTTGSYKSGNDLLNDCTSNTDSQLVWPSVAVPIAYQRAFSSGNYGTLCSDFFKHIQNIDTRPQQA
jgi:hypothetical protein